MKHRYRLLFEACLAGREPAESLPTELRTRLVGQLVAQGWTDAEIAALTRMSTYTTARIRSRDGLTPNYPALERAA